MKRTPQLNNIVKRVDELTKCVNCGLCQAVCPTYILEGYEGRTARGKIELLKRLLNSDLEPTTEIADIFDDCLTCYACQSVCPAGVKTERLWISAREDLAKLSSTHKKKLRAIKWTFRKPVLFNFGLKTYGLLFGFNREKPTKVEVGHYGLPVFRGAPYLKRLPEVVEPVSSKVVNTVGLLIGCSGNISAPWAVDAAIKLLTSAGCEVIIPKTQGCCGAPAINNGCWSEAKLMAIKTMELFDNLKVDFITSPDATCTSALQNDYGEIFQDEEEVFKRWKSFRSKVKQLSVVLEGFIRDKRLIFKNDNHKITLHNSCHNTHIGERSRWREILSMISKIKILEMPNADLCCGFGGSYSIFHPRSSSSIARKKIDAALETGADILLVGSPGCQVRLISVANNEIQVKLALELLADLVK